jgi:hypothetical protein
MPKKRTLSVPPGNPCHTFCGKLLKILLVFQGVSFHELPFFFQDDRLSGTLALFYTTLLHFGPVGFLHERRKPWYNATAIN